MQFLQLIIILYRLQIYYNIKYKRCQYFFAKNEKSFTMTSKIVNETIIEGPDGILKMYEKYSPKRIPRKEKNTDKNSIDEYLLAIIEAVA